MVDVKICGLSEPETLDAALDAGARFVGFVFHEPSPRNLSFRTAGELSKRTGSTAEKVALTVDADDEKIERIMRVLEPDYIQAHGSESPDRIRALHRATGVPIIKAIKVGNAADVAEADRYAEAAQLLLFDARSPETLENALPGGNGIPFDWTLMGGEAKRRRFMLSGGLHRDNLREAIRITKAPIVDVSSGVESSPGVKDAGLIEAFMDAARRTPAVDLSGSRPQ